MAFPPSDPIHRVGCVYICVCVGGDYPKPKSKKKTLHCPWSLRHSAVVISMSLNIIYSCKAGRSGCDHTELPQARGKRGGTVLGVTRAEQCSVAGL